MNNFDITISCPLWVWLVAATALIIIAFTAGWSLHKTHLQIKNAPKSVKKPKKQELPEGWELWTI